MVRMLPVSELQDRPVPRLLGLDELQERNRRAAEKELADMRADTIQYLRMVAQHHGNDGIRSLLVEAIPAWARQRVPPRSERVA